MLTRRDWTMFAAGAAVALLYIGTAGAQTPRLGSQAWEWSDLKVTETKVGARRTVVRAPTPTLDELEIHITTLNPGEMPHPPHQHPAEEMFIIKEGTVEALVGGQMRRVGPGSIVFQASNQPHSIKNVGTTPATYHVIQWQPPGMLEKK